MTQHCIGTYFFNNQNLNKVSNFGESLLTEGTSVYEVIRLIEGVPIFFSEHIARLQNSENIVQFPFTLNEQQVSKQLNCLLEKNEIANGNIKLQLLNDGTSIRQLIYFIPANYPCKEQYELGVRCTLLHAERKQPNAKIQNVALRSVTDSILQSTGAYETILVSENKTITEGSRSNVFLVKGNTLYTPKADKVLVGITRTKVLETAQTQGFTVVSTDVYVADLSAYDAVFITGTSPNILPVNQIDSTTYNPNNALIRQLILAFSKLISEEIVKGKSQENHC